MVRDNSGCRGCGLRLRNNVAFERAHGEPCGLQDERSHLRAHDHTFSGGSGYELHELACAPGAKIRLLEMHHWPVRPENWDCLVAKQGPGERSVESSPLMHRSLVGDLRPGGVPHGGVALRVGKDPFATAKTLVEGRFEGPVGNDDEVHVREAFAEVTESKPSDQVQGAQVRSEVRLESLQVRADTAFERGGNHSPQYVRVPC